MEEEGVTSLFDEDVLATQVIPGVEGVPSGEEATVETEFATQPENQTAWGTEVFPTDVSLLSGGSEFHHLLGHSMAGVVGLGHSQNKWIVSLLKETPSQPRQLSPY